MSSLGSQLVNNWKGGFWACGPNQTVRHLSLVRASPSQHRADSNADLLQLRRGCAFWSYLHYGHSPNGPSHSLSRYLLNGRL